VWYLLSKHPTAWRRLRAEVEEVLGGRVPTIEDLQRLRYTSMVIDESMRLYPPLWLIARTPLKDDEIAGYHVPKGTFVFCPPYVIHRHPDFWSNPEGFEPERFDPERSAGRHKYAYFPFGNGPRKCIGDYFGLVEMQLVVAMITQRYRLDLVPGHPVVAEPAISLRARDGLLMTLSPAEASGAHGGEGRAAASRTMAGTAGAGAAGGAR
jgi:cytochrome P450